MTVQQNGNIPATLNHGKNQGVKHLTTGWHPQHLSPAVAGAIPLGRKEERGLEVSREHSGWIR